jgi:hypothetical protein
MAGEFGGLGNTIDQFIGKLDSLIAKYKELAGVEGGTRTNVSTFPTPGGGTGSITINPLPMPTSSPGFSGGYDTRPIQNNFTFNTTTDATQSTAMVGAVLGQAVSKYTSTGGALKGLTVIGV